MSKMIYGEGLVGEYFGDIISELDKVENDNYEDFICNDASKSDAFKFVNTIPYGTKTETCYEKLVVVIDGRHAVDDIIRQTIMHVGLFCKGKTVKVLFYISDLIAFWNDIWHLFQPSLESLVENHKVVIAVYHKLKVQNVDLYEYVNDSLLCIAHQNNKRCKQNESIDGKFYLECNYYNSGVLRLLKFEVNKKRREALVIIVVESQGEEVQRIKECYVDEIRKFLKINIFNDMMAGKYIILTWQLPLNNKKEADHAIEGFEYLNELIKKPLPISRGAFKL